MLNNSKHIDSASRNLYVGNHGKYFIHMYNKFSCFTSSHGVPLFLKAVAAKRPPKLDKKRVRGIKTLKYSLEVLIIRKSFVAHLISHAP